MRTILLVAVLTCLLVPYTEAHPKRTGLESSQSMSDSSSQDIVSAGSRERRSRPADFVDMSEEIRRIQEIEEASDEEILLKALNQN